MLRQLQHIRFTIQWDLLSLTESDWYVQNNIEAPVGTSNDKIHRPDYILPGA